MKYRYIDSKIGPLMLAGDSKLEQVRFAIKGKKTVPEKSWVEDNTIFPDVVSQLGQYFEGRLKQFDIDLQPKGTDFQKKVWQALLAIPYGTTVSYGEIARRIENPKACRAVGMANRSNPIPIIIPCHRVIGKNGKLTGFASGLDIKQALLDLERS
ncbi:methylated-DNA--[protein]-cysteine S-methyltransferase [uncultured Desulfobacter sp.]|uniref:methylated-DNA--[protein]-cysteine S-methyltransferase n=1 Tax=uncultured Desulfobacter sp. TaxID=240139 RepID=UPI002AAA7793|nr:methylated-DNA--[protein]-cysteine S-methyltransferase [uncultured Desulfobacter sp.]